jgi:tetratricopeptide (TPR) repeat protein
MTNLDERILRMHYNVLRKKHGAAAVSDPERLSALLNKAAPELSGSIESFVVSLKLSVAAPSKLTAASKSPATFKYRAFLSYSHANTAIVRKVHERLENFRIDREIVGRPTPLGPVPPTLRPIFRDRDDFEAGSSLKDATLIALDEAAAFILLASPQAATSRYVNEEARLFKTRHPDRPLIPLIADGIPGDPQKECFPPVLRFVVSPEGTITDRPADVLAADLREQGDGFDLAIAKVVARLIGLAPDEVYRRAERERRRRNRFRGTVAAAFVLVAIAGGAFFVQSHRQKTTLDEITAIVAKVSLISPAEASAPGAKQGLTDAITAIVNGAATDPRYAKALDLLKAGNAAAAEPLLQAVAEDKERRADRNAKEAADAYRNLGAIAAVSDPARAREDYAKAARLDPSDLFGMYLNGTYQQKAGQLDAAEAAYRNVIAAAKAGAEYAENGAQMGLGDILNARGHAAEALATYRGAAALADKMANAETDNGGWQQHRSLAYDRIGSIYQSQGHLSDALANYRISLDAMNLATQMLPDDLSLQRDLSVTYERVGDVESGQGHFADALASYQAELSIIQRAIQVQPDNIEFQAILSAAYQRSGDAQRSKGDLPGALSSYQSSLAIMDKLVTADPGDVGWARDLQIFYDKVGQVQQDQGNVAGALKSFQSALAVIDAVVKSHPDNTGLQYDLGISNEQLGSLHAAQNDWAEALPFYQAKLAIDEHLVRSEPGNTSWQRDLGVAYQFIGEVQRGQGDLATALASYQAMQDVAVRLAKVDPTNTLWQRDVAVSYEKLGDVHADQGNLPAALAAYRAELSSFDRLAKIATDNMDLQRDLARSYDRVGEIYLKSGMADKARDALQTSRAIIVQMLAQAPDNPVWKDDLAYFDRKIAAMKK